MPTSVFVIFFVVWLLSLLHAIYRMMTRRAEQAKALAATEPAPPADPEVSRRFRRNRTLVAGLFGSVFLALAGAGIAQQFYTVEDLTPIVFPIVFVLIAGWVLSTKLLWRCPSCGKSLTIGGQEFPVVLDLKACPSCRIPFV